MMKYLVLSIIMIGFLSNIYAQTPADKIVGIWLSEDQSSKIEIYKSGSTYSGKIVWLKELDKNPGLTPKDKNNPKPELRNRNILGMDIITGLNYSGSKWVNGSIYTPKRGAYANCKAELQSNGQLKITGSKSGFTKVQIWNRQ